MSRETRTFYVTISAGELRALRTYTYAVEESAPVEAAMRALIRWSNVAGTLLRQGPSSCDLFGPFWDFEASCAGTRASARVRTQRTQTEAHGPSVSTDAPRAQGAQLTLV